MLLFDRVTTIHYGLVYNLSEIEYWLWFELNTEAYYSFRNYWFKSTI